MSVTRLSDALDEIRPADAAVKRRARARQRSLTKPPGSLGRLEDISVQLAGIFGTDRPEVRGRTVIIAAADHGVVARGISAYPQEVTNQMVRNFLADGAAISVLTRRLGVRRVIVDAGVAGELPASPDIRTLRIGTTTGDISQGPAMSRTQAQQCIGAGIDLAVEAAATGADLIGTGDMGIGNTTPSSAIVAALTASPPAAATGKGTGRTTEELAHKTAVVRQALEVNKPAPGDPVDVLAKVGGFEIGVLAGVVLGGAMMRRVVVLDGFISGAAALIACALSPHARDYLVASHRSAEKGHRAVLSHLGLRPLLDLGMRLGEGTGAVLAMPVIEGAAACLAEMATFAEAGVAGRTAREALERAK